MIELIGTIALCWLVFRLLDALFTRKPKSAAGQFIVQADDGNYYLVKEVEAPPHEHTHLPANVVPIRRR